MIIVISQGFIFDDNYCMFPCAYFCYQSSSNIVMIMIMMIIVIIIMSNMIITIITYVITFLFSFWQSLIC